MALQLIDKIQEITYKSGFEIVDQMTFAERKAKYGVIPTDLHPSVYNLLIKNFSKGLYFHQSLAIEHILNKKDVCLATPTASGKSLVFIAATAHFLKVEPSSRILAIYPVKALIQDQLQKWKNILGPLDISVDYIDGNVNAEARLSIIERSQVILITPDVVHTWLMSSLDKPIIRRFIDYLKILILDEVHVYDGVFGTNMAYLLRRIQAVSKLQNIITSTATIGEPSLFIEKLTGRQTHLIDIEQDGANSPPKSIYLIRRTSNKDFECMVSLLLNLSNSQLGRFLAFGDSRKLVEQLVASTGRVLVDNDANEETLLAEPVSEYDESDSVKTPGEASKILPYRAGYEEDDRQNIQRALEGGQLNGVVSTSALELGLDIGEIKIVLLMGTPPSIKAFWQRFGRTGRKTEGICLIIDDKGLISSNPNKLKEYLKKLPESAYLYLENRYIQYVNALCCATELGASKFSMLPLETLPKTFLQYLQNEINPTEAVAQELYSLKQRAQQSPHYEFPLRTGVDKMFSVRSRGTHNEKTRKLGKITYLQALREAYPGAVYYYMADAYRITEFKYKTGEIFAKREKRYFTHPIIQNMVFPKFQGGILNLFSCEDGFLAEVELQVSERVLGFTEQRGSSKTSYEYGITSSYSQKPITRFFETTGVCWYFLNRNVLSDTVASIILESFCSLCGLQSRDLGIGTFHANISPLGQKSCQGVSIYDVSHGSLRLTQQLAEKFIEIVSLALTIYNQLEEPESQDLEQNLIYLKDIGSRLKPSLKEGNSILEEKDEEWITIVAPRETAIYKPNFDTTEMIEIKDFRYTPKGFMYELFHENPDIKWMVNANHIIPINGNKLVQTNCMTGETRPVK